MQRLTATFVWYAIATLACQLGTRAHSGEKKEIKTLCATAFASCKNITVPFFLLAPYRGGARQKRERDNATIMVANVPLWVTCAVLSNAIGLAFALTALTRLGWKPIQSLQRLLCCLRKKGAESGVAGELQSHAGAKGPNLSVNGTTERESAKNATAETLEDGKQTSTTTAASGLSLAFLRARARAVSGLTKDDADSSSPQEFHGGVLSQPWQRGCACEVSLFGLVIEGGIGKKMRG